MRKYSDGGTTDYSHYVTAVAALFNQQGDILILQRGSTAPWMPNAWSLVGGVVDEGENPDEAIVREIMEETGLQVLNLQYKQTKYTKDAGKIVYYAGMLPANFIVRLDYENQDFAFVNLSNIDQYEYVPHVKAYMRNLLEPPTAITKLAEGGIVKKYGFTEAEIDKWEKENKVSQRKTQNPVVKEAITEMAEGKLTQDEYLKILQENNPIKPFDRVPPLPTLKEIVGSLKTNQLEKQGIIGYTVEIPDGAYVASRLDIPAYDNYDVWVVSVHDGKKEGNVIGYAKTAYLKNVTFKSSPKTAMRIGMGLSTKSTFARMFGTWVNKSPEVVRNMAVRYMNNPNWIQVGMNPYRHSWFYDKADGLPLVSAEEVIQVGALVLAKNAVKTTVDDPEFIVDKKNPAIKYSDGGKTGSVYYRATSEDMGKQTVFTPVNKYEAFDDEGNPLTRGASDVFVLSDIPEISASKTIGGAILGLWSMFNHNGINPVGKKIYIYEIMDRPRKDLSHVRMADFEYLKEVRYDKPVNGVRSGYFVFDTEFNNNALNFYERLNDDDPYSETQYDEDAWYEFEKYILTLNNNDIVKYADGGKTDTLLAPNGKPSNLTPEQYNLVRTPAFKAWFGDWENNPQEASKVVDNNGEPLVCFHNSRANKKFSIFIDRPTYFSNLQNYNPTGGKITYECFLQIKKPYKPKDKIHRKFIDEQLEQIKNKYDGVIGKEWTYSLDVNAYIVLNPTQIKLADGSNTTFDGNNPDIRFDKGGETPNIHYSPILKNTEIVKDLKLTKNLLSLSHQGLSGGIKAVWDYPYENVSNVVIAYINSKPIGVITDTNGVQNIFVKSEYRGFGIGKSLKNILNNIRFKKGGEVDVLTRESFFDYYNAKFGNNPDTSYADGGMTYQQYRDSQFDEQVDRHLPSGYLGEFEIKLNTKSNYPILYLEKDGYEYRLKNKNDSAIGVFHLNKQVGYADNKAIQVAPMYQKKGIGLNLVSILKERNPNHRFGSMTPEGFNLMGKYYDEKIKTNPDIGFAEGGKTETYRPYSNLDISRVKKGVVQLNSVHPKRITKIDDLPI